MSLQVLELEALYNQKGFSVKVIWRSAGAGIVINQGDIYWVRSENQGVSHPHVVIQNVVIQDTVDTIVACALTTNLKRVSLPGNVLLEAGEGNLPKQSLVEVAKVSTIGKADLGDYIGRLSEQRVEQILAGIQFIERAFMPKQ